MVERLVKCQKIIRNNRTKHTQWRCVQQLLYSKLAELLNRQAAKMYCLLSLPCAAVVCQGVLDRLPIKEVCF